MNRFIVVLCMCAPIAVTAWAQGEGVPGGKWWRQDRVVQQLGLTEEQQRKLDAIFRESASELIDLKAESEKRGLELRNALDAPQLNRQEVQRAAQNLSQARARLFERELMMFVDMRRELTAEQWTRFRQVLHNRHGMRKGAMRGPRVRPRPQ